MPPAPTPDGAVAMADSSADAVTVITADAAPADTGSGSFPDRGHTLFDAAPAADAPSLDAADAAPPDAAPGGGPEVQVPTRPPLDLLFLVDSSQSMTTTAGGRSRWLLARDGLVAFFQDARSAGLNVGLTFFPRFTGECRDDAACFLPSPGGCRLLAACLAPGAALASGRACGAPSDDPCPGGTTCTPLGRCSIGGGDCIGAGIACPSGVANDVCGPRPRQCRLGPPARGTCAPESYATPDVPLAPLASAGTRLAGALDTKLPLGGTPLGAAVKGALAYLHARPVDPARGAALVVVTDGIPEGCDNLQIAADLVEARKRTPALRAYFVAIVAATELQMVRATLNEYAVAGGTSAAFVIDPNDPVPDAIAAALARIRDAGM
jgi:Mg-chelatase subunit ChlD